MKDRDFGSVSIEPDYSIDIETGEKIYSPHYWEDRKRLLAELRESRKKKTPESR